MKSLLQLHTTMLRELAQHCSTEVTRDIEYMSRRTEDEGESFLTLSLPIFGKALEKGLSEGRFPLRDVTNFRHVRGLPSFLGGFLKQIFSREGTLLEDPDASAIWAIRQLCFLSYKIERDCTPKRVKAALDQYVSTDAELRFLPKRISAEDRDTFSRVSYRLFGDMFSELDRKIASFELVPRHGPGSVAEKLTPLEKWDLSYWTSRLESVFPHWRYRSNLPCWDTDLDLIAPGDELPVRVVTVPKTQKTPRIIAIEPSTVQYAQQGLKNEIYDFVDRSSLRDILGFSDQTRNQEMARKGSLDGSLATLDLSEASDRVHWWLVQLMVSRYPHLRDFLDATRSQRAEVEGHGVIPLVKFASMGSALTFPIEAMVFTTLALMGMGEQGKRAITVSRLRGVVSVYGDDIIVPVDRVAHVIDRLETFGFKVNRTKSHWRGYFRESCGKEYYRGEDVSIQKFRHDFPSSREDATLVAGLVDFRNRCYYAGLWGVVRELDKVTKKFVAFVPSRDSSIGLVHATLLPPNQKVRYNEHLQRSEVKVPYLHPHGKSYQVDGERGLLNWFQQVNLRKKAPEEPSFTSQERPTAFSIYSRWTFAR